MGEDVPPPETSVVLDGLLFRCELVVYVSKGGQVKDLRLRGPLRGSRNEALKDCVELRHAAVEGGPQDPALEKVRQKRGELEATVWTEKDLADDALQCAEGPVEVPASWGTGVAIGLETVADSVPTAVVAETNVCFTPVNIEERVAKLKEDRGLDESAAQRLVNVFKSRAALGCNLSKDFDEIDQHLAASNKPSALVSMKLGELRDGRPIGPCKYSGSRKDALAAKQRVERVHLAPQALVQVEKPEPLFKPVGPNWRKPGQLCRLPQDSGDWLVHERQDAAGKYRPWIFFNSDTGRYFQEKDSSAGYIGVGVPHNPKEYGLTIRASSTSLPSRTGKKLDMAVLLPELHKTGAVLKQPLEFLDRPASLFVLCDGLRDTAAATEFCVRKFHSLLLPRLSGRATEWEDFELVDIIQESTEALDSLLIDAPARFAGCSLAVALVVGTRLIVGSLGATRCLFFAPSAEAKQVRGVAASRRTAPWTSTLLAGGSVHSTSSREECLRIASAGDRLLDEAGGASAQLHPRSTPQALLEASADDQERELLRISRATNAFAALGLTTADIEDGPSAVRRIFRKRSLAVHPDKVNAPMKARAAAAFAKLEAAVTAVEAMIQADASAAALVAELFAAYDSSWPEADPAAAALLLGVQDSCSAAAVKEAVRKRFHVPLSHLQDACPKEVKHALKILEAAGATLARGPPALWTPSAEHAAISVTRALGCGDLKSPAPLLTTQLATHVVQLEPGSCYALALLTDGMRSLTDSEVSAHMQKHGGRPRAAALQLALAASKSTSSSHGEAVGAVCVFMDHSASSSTAADGAPPAPKRIKTGAGASPERVRVSHILLRWAGLKGADVEERPGFPPPTRSQAQVEQELLALLEQLLSGEAKTRAARFKSAVLKHSECPSALNVPYADVGWIERGMTEPALEAAAFDIAVSDVSDIIITQRGAHLLYRLA